jgi:Protein of unknown function (DUF3306)
MNADDFFSRWSKAKPKSAENSDLAALDNTDASKDTVSSKYDDAVVLRSQTALSSKEYTDLPAPTLDDAQALTPESDFKRFMQKDVDANVKNTALKKLWADPRFNVQDGLDIYIDDYSKPDPLPEGMLAKLAHTGFLTLFDPKPEDEDIVKPADKLSDESAQLVEPSPPTIQTTDVAVEPKGIETNLDENADLQLQPNDAAGREGDKHGSG